VENCFFSVENPGETLWRTKGSCGEKNLYTQPVENPLIFSTGFPQVNNRLKP